MICLIVSSCSFSNLSIFFLTSFFLSLEPFMVNWCFSAIVCNSAWFNSSYRLIYPLNYWDSCSCDLLSSSYLALYCMTYFAWLESNCWSPFSNYSFLVLISSSNFFLNNFFFSMIALYFWVNWFSSEWYLSFNCLTWSSLIEPELFGPSRSFFSCLRLSI